MYKLLGLFLLFSTTALAARDSVAYFYSSTKANILINERGYQSRLQQLMDVVGAGDSMLLISKDQDIKLGCARSDERTTCTFTFYPSSSVKFQNKKMYVETELTKLGLDESLEFEMSFEGSMKDQVHLRFSQGKLFIFASK